MSACDDAKAMDAVDSAKPPAHVTVTSPTYHWPDKPQPPTPRTYPADYPAPVPHAVEHVVDVESGTAKYDAPSYGYASFQNRLVRCGSGRVAGVFGRPVSARWFGDERSPQRKNLTPCVSAVCVVCGPAFGVTRHFLFVLDVMVYCCAGMASFARFTVRGIGGKGRCPSTQCGLCCCSFGRAVQRHCTSVLVRIARVWRLYYRLEHIPSCLCGGCVRRVIALCCYPGACLAVDVFVLSTGRGCSGILFLQLLITLGLTLIFVYVDAPRTYVQSHSWTFIVAA